MQDKPIYLTTAIVYPNSRIHIGWAWEVLGTDWLAKSYRSLGHDVFFATGMDEHAAKVQKRAEEQGLSPKAYCDQMAKDIEPVLQKMGITYDRFIRTSDEDHLEVVKILIEKAFAKGDIYRSTYEGLYCEGCEAYYTEKDLTEAGLCPSHQTPPKRIKEENYFFKLSKYQNALLEHLKKHPEFIQPAHRRQEIINFVESGLKDFSVSRSTFTWGIELPFEKGHIVYVWYDALLNYLTAAGVLPKIKPGAKTIPSVLTGKDPDFCKLWPADVHVVGKDVNRFHTIYWPAMLMSLDIPLPKQVFVHGFLNLRGERLSKSSGNTITPDEVMAVTGADPLRYYLLADSPFSGEGNFSWEALIGKVNSDLSNDWGNLVNRTIGMKRKYFPDEPLVLDAAKAKDPNAGGFAEATKNVLSRFQALIPDLKEAVEAREPSQYIAKCLERSRVLNLYIDQMKPWTLAKEAGLGGKPSSLPEAEAKQQADVLREVLYTVLEGIRHIAVALSPVLPYGMPEVFKQLKVESCTLADLKWAELKGKAVHHHPDEGKPIYPRIELPQEE